jgi:hypothetical protein
VDTSFETGGAASSSGGVLDPGPGRFQLGCGGVIDPGPGRFQLGDTSSDIGIVVGADMDVPCAQADERPVEAPPHGSQDLLAALEAELRAADSGEVFVSPTQPFIPVAPAAPAAVQEKFDAVVGAGPCPQGGEQKYKDLGLGSEFEAAVQLGFIPASSSAAAPAGPVSSSSTSAPSASTAAPAGPVSDMCERGALLETNSYVFV